MPADRSRRTEHLFILRLWSESSADDLDAWRGSIEHVDSKRRLYFTHVGELPSFVTACLHDNPAVIPGKER